MKIVMLVNWRIYYSFQDRGDIQLPGFLEGLFVEVYSICFFEPKRPLWGNLSRFIQGKGKTRDIA